MWGSPKTRGAFLGVPIARSIVFGGLYWGPPMLGSYHAYPGLDGSGVLFHVETCISRDEVIICSGF